MLCGIFSLGANVPDPKQREQPMEDNREEPKPEEPEISPSEPETDPGDETVHSDSSSTPTKEKVGVAGGWS